MMKGHHQQVRSLNYLPDEVRFTAVVTWLSMMQPDSSPDIYRWGNREPYSGKYRISKSGITSEKFIDKMVSSKNQLTESDLSRSNSCFARTQKNSVLILCD